jgi:hypothetical protein
MVKPRDKATVENHVHLSYLRTFALLCNIISNSLDAINIGIMEYIETHNNMLMQYT